MTWMPSDSRPIEPGVYPVKITSSGQAGPFSFWDGIGWHELRDTADLALMAPYLSVTQNKEWNDGTGSH